jgi:hypothetical protein
MAKIDLKNARIYIRDGGNNASKAGAINNVAGYPAATTALTVDSFTGAVETGGKLAIGNNLYKITAHTETTSNTTSITIEAPGLIDPVTDNQVITAYEKQEEIEVKVGDGTLTYSEKRNVEYTTNRGALSEVRLGDEVPMDVKFDFVWEYIKGLTGTITVEDALKKTGDAATWVSSDTDACRPYAVDVAVVYTPSCSTTDSNEEIVLEDFRWESLDHDIKAGTVSCTGKCNRTTAVARRY